MSTPELPAGDQAEVWLPIVGFERYEVSDRGRVRSFCRPNHPRILRPRPSPWGYVHVLLFGSGESKPVKRDIHALVASAFLGSRPDGMVTRHLDGNPGNNVLGNLAWGTQGENMLDRRRHGTDPNVAKTHCPKGHPYDAANTYIHRTAGQIHRHCRACMSAATKRAAERRRNSGRVA